MIYSDKDFEKIIDDMIPDNIQDTLNIDTRDNSVSTFECMNLMERARVYTIKHKISSTHIWQKAKIFNPNSISQNRIDVFWCSGCNLKASVFDHIKTLSAISKVEDRLPSYTIHNKYIMHTCKKIQSMRTKDYSNECFDCGIPEQGKTMDCIMVSIEDK